MHRVMGVKSEGGARTTPCASLSSSPKTATATTTTTTTTTATRTTARKRRTGGDGSISPTTPALTPLPPRNIFDGASPGVDEQGYFVAPWWHLAAEVVLFAMFIYYVPRDLFKRGFSASNGRFVSFMSSFHNCYAFRTQRPLSPYGSSAKRRRRKIDSFREKAHYHVTSSLHSMWARARIFVLGVCIKYGASTAVSLILGTTPVILKGPRHLISFFVALGFVQFLPGDYAYRVANASPRCHLVMATCSSIYTLRKLLYVVTFFDGREIWGSWLPALGVALVAVDGGSISRRLENVVTNRGIHRRRLGRELLLALRFFWDRNATLLLFVSGLHLTSNTCFALTGASPVLAESLACYLHLLAKAATLFLLLFRKRVWLAQRGESYLWCSGLCYLFGESHSGIGEGPQVKLQLPLSLRALNLATTRSAVTPYTARKAKSTQPPASGVVLTTPKENTQRHRNQHVRSPQSQQQQRSKKVD